MNTNHSIYKNKDPGEVMFPTVWNKNLEKNATSPVIE